MHRSEDFARGMAKTLQLGLDLIASLIPCADGHRWGEPDLEHAAELMQPVAARRLKRRTIVLMGCSGHVLQTRARRSSPWCCWRCRCFVIQASSTVCLPKQLASCSFTPTCSIGPLSWWCRNDVSTSVLRNCRGSCSPFLMA